MEAHEKWCGAEVMNELNEKGREGGVKHAQAQSSKTTEKKITRRPKQDIRKINHAQAQASSQRAPRLSLNGL